MTTSIVERPGRNQPCHCGSGRKYKHCCLGNDEAAASAARAVAAEAAPRSEESPTPPPRTAAHHTHQPWKTSSSRGFVPQMKAPRKAGGS